MSRQNVTNEVNEEYSFFHNYVGGEDAYDENELLTIQRMSKELRCKARKKIKLADSIMRDASKVELVMTALKAVLVVKIFKTIRNLRRSVSGEREKKLEIIVSIRKYILKIMGTDKIFAMCEGEIQRQKCIKEQLESYCKRSKFQLYRAAMRRERNINERKAKRKLKF